MGVKGRRVEGTDVQRAIGQEGRSGPGGKEDGVHVEGGQEGKASTLQTTC